MESVQGMGIERLHVFFIGRKPGVASESPAEGTIRQFMDDSRSVASASDFRHGPGQHQTRLCPRIVPGSAGQDQRRDLVVMSLQILAGHERSHGMSQQCDGHIFEPGPDAAGDLVKVFDNGLSVFVPEKSQGAGLQRLLSVSPVVMDHAPIAPCGEKLHERQIPFLVLAHAMGYLHDARQCPGIVRKCQQDIQRQAVLPGCQGKVFGFHCSWHSLLLFRAMRKLVTTSQTGISSSTVRIRNSFGVRFEDSMLRYMPAMS